MNCEKYRAILYFPHHRSEKHAHMTNCQRAAQFAPFAALTGHSRIISEAGRLTEPYRELSEDRKAEIDAVLRKLSRGSAVKLRYFKPDSRKNGGTYVTASGTVKRIDPISGAILLSDETKIPFENIRNIRQLPA